MIKERITKDTRLRFSELSITMCKHIKRMKLSHKAHRNSDNIGNHTVIADNPIMRARAYKHLNS